MKKNTRYFLNLEKHNYDRKNITKLTSDGVSYHTGENEIRKCIHKFYSQLYTEKHVEADDQKRSEDLFLSKVTTPKLNETDKIDIDKPLLLHELSQALRDLPNSKTPGSDGLSTEFYKFFWSDIKDLVHESFTYSFEKGELSTDQKRGIITLLPKDGKDITNIKNWRPITLLNTDYKLLTKALAESIEKLSSS